MELELTSVYRELEAAFRDLLKLTGELIELDFDVEYDRIDGLLERRGEYIASVRELTDKSLALIATIPAGEQVRALCRGDSSAAYDVPPVLKTQIADLLCLVKENTASDLLLKSKYMNQYDEAKSHLTRSVENKKKIDFYSVGNTAKDGGLYFRS